MSDQPMRATLTRAGAVFGIALSSLIALLSVAVPSHAQFQSCGDTISLYSPSGLTVNYEVASNPQRVDGIRLRWEELADSLAGCRRLEIDPVLEAELGVELSGDYRNVFDRNIVFNFPEAGMLGDPASIRFPAVVSNAHPNPAAGNLSAGLNLGGGGGLYRFAPVASGNMAYQINEGVPVHLGDVNVNAFAESADGNTVYATVTGVPVLRSDDGGMTWIEPQKRIFPPFSTTPTVIVVFPDDSQHIWVGTRQAGLWESLDGGANFEQIYPAGVGPRSTVTVLSFEVVMGAGGSLVDRLYLSAADQALVYSDDLGVSFTSVGDFLLPSKNQSAAGVSCGATRLDRADVLSVAVSPNDPSRVFVGLASWGVYEGDSRDHSTWTARSDGLVLCAEDGNPERPLGEQRSVTEIVVLDNQGVDVLVASTQAVSQPDGIPDLRSMTVTFVSVDGGLNWTTKGDGYPVDSNSDPLGVTGLVADPRPGNGLGVLLTTFGDGIYELNLGGGPGQGNWAPMDFGAGGEVVIDRLTALMVTANGEVILGSSGGGVYSPGEWIDLTRTLNRNAQSFSEVIPLGLSVRFTGSGVIEGGETFAIKAQNYRGYAVWRAVDIDNASGEPKWELIGLLDRANPETCVLAKCDQLAQSAESECFADKRANCFVPVLNDREEIVSWEFFDRDVFNGYTYWYAVSAFDFGYTGEVSPQSFDGDMVFSPRWPVETEPAAAIFSSLAGGANYNGVRFQVNVEVAPALVDNEIYVVPNPLVRSAGWDLGDASSIRIVNVTASSRVEIYTLAGDLIRELENVQFDGAERGNIEWDTRNDDGKSVSSGVYIYRLTDDNGGEVLGRFTIVR